MVQVTLASNLLVPLFNVVHKTALDKKSQPKYKTLSNKIPAISNSNSTKDLPIYLKNRKVKRGQQIRPARVRGKNR